MARKKTRSSSVRSNSSMSAAMGRDLGSWNFVIFLTLAFVLLVVVVISMKGVALDLRSKAGLTCPNPLTPFNGHLPNKNDCAGDWKVSEDSRGCQIFVCQPK